jgi:hypothetical protein
VRVRKEETTQRRRHMKSTIIEKDSPAQEPRPFLLFLRLSLSLSLSLSLFSLSGLVLVGFSWDCQSQSEYRLTSATKIKPQQHARTSTAVPTSVVEKPQRVDGERGEAAACFCLRARVHVCVFTCVGCVCLGGSLRAWLLYSSVCSRVFVTDCV